MSDTASLVLDAITAGAAVTVAIIANSYAKRQTTLQALGEFTDKIAELHHEYRSLNGPDEITLENAELIDQDKDLSFVVITTLDRYERFSLAVIERIVDPRICKRLVRGVVIGGYSHFRNYILYTRRDSRYAKAWEDFEAMAISWSDTSLEWAREG